MIKYRSTFKDGLIRCLLVKSNGKTIETRVKTPEYFFGFSPERLKKEHYSVEAIIDLKVYRLDPNSIEEVTS